MADDAAVFRKSRAVLQAAIMVAGGDYHRVDFHAARDVWIANLTPSERIRAAELEAELKAAGDRRTPEA